jgi:hypothetical protein
MCCREILPWKNPELEMMLATGNQQKSKRIIWRFTLIFAAQNLTGAYRFFQRNLLVLVRIDATDPSV